jgi:hypothetical protein
MEAIFNHPIAADSWRDLAASQKRVSRSILARSLAVAGVARSVSTMTTDFDPGYFWLSCSQATSWMTV